MIKALLIIFGLTIGIGLIGMSIALFAQWVSFNVTKVGDEVLWPAWFCNPTYGNVTQLVPMKVTKVSRKNKFIVDYITIEDGTTINSFVHLLQDVKHIHTNDKWYEYLYRYSLWMIK